MGIRFDHSHLKASTSSSARFVKSSGGQFNFSMMEVSVKPPSTAFVADEEEEEKTSIPDHDRFLLSDIIQHFDVKGSEVYYYIDPFSGHCYFDICYCDFCQESAFEKDDEDNCPKKKKKQTSCNYEHKYPENEDPYQPTQTIRSQYDPLTSSLIDES